MSFASASSSCRSQKQFCGHRAAPSGSREALLRLKQRAAVRRSVSMLSIDAPEARDGLSITCADNSTVFRLHQLLQHPNLHDHAVAQAVPAIIQALWQGGRCCMDMCIMKGALLLSQWPGSRHDSSQRAAEADAAARWGSVTAASAGVAAPTPQHAVGARSDSGVAPGRCPCNPAFPRCGHLVIGPSRGR